MDLRINGFVRPRIERAEMKRVIRNLILFCLTAFFVTSGQVSGSEKAESKHKSFRVVGYLPEYRMDTIHDSWGEYLTDIIYFSVEPKASGELNTSRLNEKALKQLRELAERHKIRILICVGGWGRSQNFPAVSKDRESRRKFIGHLQAFCKKYGFAGVDYDWEFPKNKLQEKAYSDLLVETKNAFRADGLLVTVAVGHNKRLSAAAYKAIDYVHLMSYDHGRRHATFDGSVADVKRHLKFGAPTEKLCLGVPFYGRNMKNRNEAKAYSDIVKTFNPAAKSDEAGGIYFNGIHTIQAKTRYALKNELAGIMIWELGQDTFDDSSLLQAISRTVINVLHQAKTVDEQKNAPDKK